MMILFKKVFNLFRRFIFGFYNPRYYPECIRDCFNNLDSTKIFFDESSIEIKRFFYLRNLALKMDGDFESPQKNRLTGRPYDLEPLFFFDHGDLDEEQINNLYRFYWLFENPDPSNWTKIIYWDCYLFNNKFSIKPYNISERFSSLVTYLFINDNLSDLQKKTIVTILVRDIALLCKNIEFPYTGIINNHIINNAKAIALAAFVFDNKSLANLSSSILQYSLDHFFDHNGVLNENSLHYQFIVAKRVHLIQTILQDYFSFNLIDVKVDIIYSSTSKMYNILINNNVKDIPPIGDISPDSTPVLSNFSCFEKNRDLYDFDDLSYLNDLQISNWVFIFYQKNVLVYNNYLSDINIYGKGHGHLDFAHFVLYSNGLPVVLDIGNYSYSKLLLDKYRSSCKHSFSLRKKNSSSIIHPLKILSTYYLDKNTSKYTIKFRLGFEFDNNITREIILTSNSITINDLTFLNNEYDCNVNFRISEKFVDDIRVSIPNNYNYFKDDFFYPAYGIASGCRRYYFSLRDHIPNTFKIGL